MLMRSREGPTGDRRAAGADQAAGDETRRCHAGGRHGPGTLSWPCMRSVTMPALTCSALMALQSHLSCFCIPSCSKLSNALAPESHSQLQIDLPRADGDGAAPMETDDTAAGDGDDAAAAAAELDFSRLKRQHLGTHTPAERDKVAAELESGIEETKAQLERVAPNLKVGLRAASDARTKALTSLLVQAQ